MTTLLVTRPEPQAERTTRQLEAAGYTVIRAPMLSVAYHPGAAKEIEVAIEAEAPQAVLITSQHSARALSDVPTARGYAVLCVGPASAEAAREAGATQVTVADGDAASLRALTQAQCTPGGGPLIYLRADDIAADLPGQLRKDGFTVVEILTYEARPVARLPDAAAEALLAGRIDGVLFYSGRTAEIFLEAAAGGGLLPRLAEVTAVAIGETVAGLLRGAGWKQVATVRLSDPESALAGLDSLFSSRGGAKADVMDSSEIDDAAPEDATARRRSLRGGLLLLGAVALLGALATGQYLHAKRKDLLSFPGERPAEHQFAEMPALPPRAPEPAQAAPAPASEPAVLSDAKSPPVTLPAVSSPEAAPPPAPPAIDPALGQKIDALQHQLDEQSARIEALEQAMAQEKTENETLGGERAALVGLVKLRRLIETGQPFADELSALLADETLDGELRDTLASLQETAAVGIATPDQLRATFDAALAAYEASPAPGKTGFWSGVKARLGTLVIIRKIGPDHPGDDDGSIIARTEAATRDGRFDAALKESSLLSEAAAPSFAEYRKAMRTRLKSLDALDRAENRLAGQ